MAGVFKKLYFADGVAVTAPSDLTVGTASGATVYADDSAYVTANGTATDGDFYVNSTNKTMRFFITSNWRENLAQGDATDPTKKIAFSLSGNATGLTSTLAFANSSSGKTYTFQNSSDTIVGRATTDTLTNKTLTAPLITTNGSIDVTGAGTLAIGASVGANNLTLGGASSTVVVAGNLTVSGTTTTVNSTTLDVADKNINVNDGGNDASSEGAGLNVERTGTHGSLIYADAATSKFKIGAAGSEAEVATISHAQSLTNKTINSTTNTIKVSDSTFAVFDSVDSTKYIEFNAAGSTSTSTNIASSQTANRVITLPDATDTLVGKATTDTLTNKTLGSPTVTGTLLLQNPSGAQPELHLSEDPDNGTNVIKIKAPATLAGDVTLTLPDTDGDADQVLSTNGSGVLSWASVVAGTVTSGTYTPSSLTTSNIDAATYTLSNYMRINNTVHVSGRMSIDPTATGTVAVTITLPIASNFTTSADCTGVLTADNATERIAGRIASDTTNDGAQLIYIATSAANDDVFFTFTYRIV